MEYTTYFSVALEGEPHSFIPIQDEFIIDNSRLESLSPRQVVHWTLKALRRGNGGGDDGCGVGMFIEAEEGVDGDEIYMPMPNMAWHR